MDNKPTDGIRIEPASQGITYPFLRIYEEEGPFLKSFKISTRLVVIGRDKAADLRIHDKYISRKHFQIEFLGEGKVFLQDLGSANGVFVNGKKVERSKLDDGDEIVVGEKRIVVSYKYKKPKPAPPIKKSSTYAATSPGAATPFDAGDKTDVATEEELKHRAAEATVADTEAPSETELELERPAPSPEPPKKKKKRDPEAETVKVVSPKPKPKPPAEDTKEASSDMADILEIASLRERRSEIRSEEIAREEAEEKKIRLRKLLFIFIVGIFGTFILFYSFKYARNYIAGPSGPSSPEESMAKRNDYSREKPLIPRPDVNTKPKIERRSGDLIVKEDAIRKDLSKSLAQVKKRQRTKRRSSASSSKRKSTSRSTSRVTPRIRPRPKPTQIARARPTPRPKSQKASVPNVAKTLQSSRVLDVELDKASKSLVASRESRSGKQTQMGRKININQVKELLDIDVGLSIMSEEVMLSEKRDVGKFRNNLKKKISAVGYCYQDALKKDPSIHGDIKVNFTIARGGRVTRARVEDSSIRNRSLRGCIINRVKQTRFEEPPHDNFMISYTFKFKKNTMDFR